MPDLSEPQSSILSIRGLHVAARKYDDLTPILKGIDLELAPGEVLGLVGESGAGKSTLGLAALGFFRAGCVPTGGEVVFGGKDLLQLPEAQRRGLRGSRIAYVAQSAMAAFNPGVRLMAQIIRAPLRNGEARNQAEARAVELFRALQLPDPETFGQRYPHQVSGGQLQRAMVAMAMISRPDIIVFDEPTTALDVTTQVEVLVAIRQAIREQGVAALYITHDLAVVAQIAHRVMVLRYGEAVEVAPIDQILNAPQHPYTRSLWAVRAMEHEAHAGTGPLLELNGVDAYYRDFKVLHDIGLSIGRGQTVALVGESGSGKSTLGRVIAGLLPPKHGQMQFDGRELEPALRDRDTKDLRRIQFVYQSAETALNPRQKIRKIVGRPLQMFHGLTGGALARRLDELMRMVELDGSYLDRYPAQLSGGQRQRISIARALAAEPELIICDEVTSALDKVVQSEVLKVSCGSSAV